jgi:hypothetical protein
MRDNVGATYTVLTALLCAREAGIPVKGKVISRGIRYLRSTITRKGSVKYSKRFPLGEKAGPRGLYLVRPGGALYPLYRTGYAGDKRVKRCVKYFLKRKNKILRQIPRNNDPHFTHGLLFATLGMYQIGGKHWRSYYEKLRDKLIKYQNEDGSWGPKKDFLMPASPSSMKTRLMRKEQPRAYETARFLFQLLLPLGNLKTLSTRVREY